MLELLNTNTRPEAVPGIDAAALSIMSGAVEAARAIAANAGISPADLPTFEENTLPIDPESYKWALSLGDGPYAKHDGYEGWGSK